MRWRKMKRKDDDWRKMDNSAKIFPLSGNRKYSTVFRISVVLKDMIEPEILQKAVCQTPLKKSNVPVRFQFLFELVYALYSFSF